ncbi:MAG TPA: PSD1 and planctomycete cytochrome C domain-containing protein [Candidatus Limnocylindrales bacterium]|nr:PSD1 and planctomycete cytochrome C domain-containing protein [Candidatus Limnocylindrales bacterium]
MSSTSLAGAEATTEEIEFFEKNVRPLFAENCYQCHSDKAEKIKGGLHLDSTAALSKGGTSGAAIVPGDPDASLLIKAVRYTDAELQMPPKDKKLPDDSIKMLETWVKMGAPMPKEAGPPPLLTQIATARARHWAFQLVKKPPVPPVRHRPWVKTPMDNFVLANLEAHHLQPAPAADRRSLIRRVTYDLIGLPPSYNEVQAFAEDRRPDAYARVVERLLASPHYGERWGRYWLDIARYADTKGYLPGGVERRYAFSYTYRDYVVRAFNEDKPYNQFLVEQIAADKLTSGDDKRSLAALGFLTLGRRFLNNQNDIIDDRIDVISRGTLGLTVTCARCHDHKFDPIPTKDYYALHGVFASSEEPAELPLLGPLRTTSEYEDYLKEKAKIEEEIVDFRQKEIATFLKGLRDRVGDYLMGVHDAARLSDPSKFDTFAGEHKLNPAVLRRWMKYLEDPARGSNLIFSTWFQLAKLSESDFTNSVRPFLTGLLSEPSPANPVLAQFLSEQVTNSLQEVATAYNRLFQNIDKDWEEALKAAGDQVKPTRFPGDDKEALRQVLYAGDSPVNLPQDEAEAILERRLNGGIAPIRNKIEALSWTHAGAPARAMALVDRTEPGNSHVLLRGNPDIPGEEVPRRFLEVLSAGTRPAFTNGSGRLELAQAIASADNPLTARVYVNRVWLHHFGEGLVSTPGDFGVRTEEPVQRPLLDYLAASFVENGWSTKYLHRVILLSATYQQASDAPIEVTKEDPDNRWISRMNRQRLDFESLRDTLLALAGKLDLSVGGLPVELGHEPFPTRRTLYALIDRQNLPAVFRTFDFANPDTSSQRRFQTTVPQQALFLMNSPFTIEQARKLAERQEISCLHDTREQVQALYRIVFQRQPTKNEIRLAREFIAAQSARSDFGPLARYAQVLLLSNEMMFVD